MFKYILPLVLAFPVYADDNQITIQQSGDSFELDITQVGYGNIIRRWRTTDNGISGADNVITIRQHNNLGSGSDKNILEIRQVVGQGNNLVLGQGYIVDSSGNYTLDDSEYGDTFAHINVTGDYNDIKMQQTTGGQDPGGHRYHLHVEGDNNDIYTKQQGGDQYINLDIYNDGNDVEIRQKNNGDHYASVILRGTEPTSIYVMQNGWSDNTYSVTNYCYTSGGCNISVSQE